MDELVYFRVVAEPGAYRTTDLMNHFGHEAREAVWRLLDDGRLSLTRDRYLVVDECLAR